MHACIASRGKNEMDDRGDTDRCHHKLIAKVNDILCTFRTLDSFVKLALIKSYCLSLYSYELYGT